MHRFWESTLWPLLEATQPQSIVEIGSEYGHNTRNLLRFCHERGAKLHVVDPLPKYDISEWQREHGETLIFHQTLSLNAIQNIARMDAVLIDGDHNWYTVFSELKLIEKRCADLSQPFPLVMLHDVGWPYGRRDLYYNPETIPEAHRKPYSQKGLRPDTPEAVEGGGINMPFHNALHENSLQSGVLTAVEDFLKETEQEIQFSTIPGLHGLGILVPQCLVQGNSELVRVFEALQLSPVATQLIERVEQDRLETLVLEQEKDRAIRDLQAQNQKLYHDVQQLSNWMRELESGLSALIGSRRWKAASALAELRRRALLRPRGTTVVDSIHHTLRRFQAWKRADGQVTKKKAEVTAQPSAATLVTKRHKPKVSILVWEVSQNPMGRAYLIADVLSRKFDVEIIGSKFPRYGDKVWEPVRDGEFPVAEFTGQRFPEHFLEMEQAARKIDGDVLFVSKPRLPSYELGIMAKRFRNVPLILDVDDRELSFFNKSTGLSLRELEEHRDEGELYVPYGELWTRYCESLIPCADHVTVSNRELQKLYGGTIFPHVKDERRFDPTLYDREAIRANLRLNPDDKVILFVGTPRRHKGVLEIAQALEKIGNPKYKLCIVGTVVDPGLREQLERLQGDHVRMMPDRSYRDLPATLAAGDLVCLLQNKESAISEHQLPSKFTDALAMGIPILTSDVPPLANLAQEGLVEPLSGTPLHQKIEEIFSDYTQFKERAAVNRERFLSEYSYAALAPKLEKIIYSLLEDTPPIPEEFEKLLSFQREVFSLPPEISNRKLSEAARQEALPKVELDRAVEKRRAARKVNQKQYVDDKYDMVIFWKQNDSGIYGRRQDMLVKYFAASSRVNRILHFDAPMAAKRLLSLPELQRDDRFSEKNQVFLQTLTRSLRLRDSGKVKRYTFLYTPPRNTGGRILSRLFPEPREYLRYVSEILRKNGVGERRTVFWLYPVNYQIRNIVEFFDPEFVVTDVVDDQRGWLPPGSPERERMAENYKEALGLSDLAITNSQPLRESMRNYVDDMQLVPNACELPDKSVLKKRRPRELTKIEGPIIGYVGYLALRIDTELLEYVASVRPDWSLVLIGHAPPTPEIAKLRAYDNIHLLGVKNYSSIQRYIREFDVAVVPHLNNEMTKAMNPLKQFVYAAMDVPIVSTEVEGLSELQEIVHVAASKEEFIEKIELALVEGNPPGTEGKCAELLKNNSWEERINKILELIDQRWSEETDAATEKERRKA